MNDDRHARSSRGTRGQDETVHDDISDDDPRLVAALQEYLAAVEAGRHPDRKAFLERHADIASALAFSLQGLAFVHSAAAQSTSGSAEERADRHIDPEIAGRPLGDFRLIREIGRGGMGVVYEAVQMSLGRRVALKVLSFAATLDTRQLERFRNEAHAAAQLHHSNIVPVYAVGCERSVHFYAMQLIEGPSLAQVIADLRSRIDDDGQQAITQTVEPTRGRQADAAARLDYEARHPLPYAGTRLSEAHSQRRSEYVRLIAKLAMQAAEALDYAHKKGVVHRDVKPANLLLDQNGHLWVADFGLAQVYATEGNLTRTGDLPGTLRYMSPEQASGRAVVLDQRTDVYSLGITLYELLTLERAFGADNREQLLHDVQSSEPRSLRSFAQFIPRELETIVGKAIAKEPGDRYSSARAFADDLGRFLRDEPIHAKPPSILDKGVKWTRRHRGVAAAAFSMLLLLAVGLSASTFVIATEQRKTKAAYDRERDQHAAAEANFRLAQQNLALADRNFRQATDAVQFFTRIARDDMAKDPAFGELRRQMLEASLAYYQTFLDEHKGDPTTAGELREASTNVRAILSELSAFDSLFRTFARQSILSQESVRSELGLGPLPPGSDAEQLSTWGAALKLSKEPGVSNEARAEQVTRLARTLDAEQRRSLSASQYGRLEQVARQAFGAFAFAEPAVVEALSLTPEQRTDVQSVLTELKAELFRPRWPGKDPGATRPSQDSEKVGIKADALPRILRILSPQQRDTWTTLIGPPFEGKLNGFPPHDPPPDHGDDR